MAPVIPHPAWTPDLLVTSDLCEYTLYKIFPPDWSIYAFEHFRAKFRSLMLCATCVFYVYACQNEIAERQMCDMLFNLGCNVFNHQREKMQLLVQIMWLQSRRSPFLHPNLLRQTWLEDDGVNKCDARAQIVLKDKFNPPSTFKFDHYLTPRVIGMSGEVSSSINISGASRRNRTAAFFQTIEAERDLCFFLKNVKKFLWRNKREELQTGFSLQKLWDPKFILKDFIYTFDMPPNGMSRV